MHLKKKFTDVDQKTKTVNYAKEARLKRSSVTSNAKTSNDITGEDSLYGGGHNWKIGDDKLNADSLYDPYEPYNQNVFESCEDNILDDSEYIFDYLTQVIGIENKNIILFGRSMGSGPATHLSSVRTPGALLLMSSFKSI